MVYQRLQPRTGKLLTFSYSSNPLFLSVFSSNVTQATNYATQTSDATSLLNNSTSLDLVTTSTNASSLKKYSFYVVYSKTFNSTGYNFTNESWFNSDNHYLKTNNSNNFRLCGTAHDA